MRGTEVTLAYSYSSATLAPHASDNFATNRWREQPCFPPLQKSPFGLYAARVAVKAHGVQRCWHQNPSGRGVGGDPPTPEYYQKRAFVQQLLSNFSKLYLLSYERPFQQEKMFVKVFFS